MRLCGLQLSHVHLLVDYVYEPALEVQGWARMDLLGPRAPSSRTKNQV